MISKKSIFVANIFVYVNSLGHNTFENHPKKKEKKKKKGKLSKTTVVLKLDFNQTLLIWMLLLQFLLSDLFSFPSFNISRI